MCNQGWVNGLFASELMAPDGHVDVGSFNSLLPWSNDYAGNQGTMSLLLHELFHVYQVRNLRYGVAEIAIRKAASLAGSGYTYCPLSSPTFASYNLEQQAEMIQDRYRLRTTDFPSSPLKQSNSCGTFNGLNAIVPYELW